ncbi:hypothetical protein [Acholeplasma granularum]|uniref:hypothetical protein n=1 Tax=Acholeplasma granularum TaxID=264635 RepID=UPI00046FD123|nr:hypothetical protein [Acholeplasma granularum]
MKKILSMLFVLVGILSLIACTPSDDVNLPSFDGEPTVTQHTDAGKLQITAESTHEEGRIFYAVYLSSVTTKTASEVVLGEGSVSKGSSTSKSLDVVLTLEADTDYAVFFVVAHGETYTSVKRVTGKTKAVEQLTLGFSSLALATGTEDGEIILNAQSNGLGTIYYVLVEEGKQAPTASQIKAGANYGDVVVVKSGNGASLSNVVLSGLTPQSRYTAYFVVELDNTFSTVRNMSATAKLNIVQIDKGEGTEENPFRISTIQDLEQIGKGFYELTGKEWTVTDFYVLENDIDLTEKYGAQKESFEPLGADSQGSRFEGTLDGAGFSIIGLYIDKDSSIAPYRGLFASSEATAVVKNIKFVNPYVHASGIGESDSNHGAGIIFGYLKGTIDNVEIINGVVEDTLNGTRVGAIAGRMYVTGSITNTYINADVSAFNRVGGAVGVVDTSSAGTAPIVFKNIVFDGSVIGEDEHIGGLIGYARAADVSNVFITGYIQGARNTGGVLGFFQKRGDNSNVIASIKDVIVHATIYGTGTAANVGEIIGNRSTSGLTGFEHLLLIGNLYTAEGSSVDGGGGASAINGTPITLEELSTKAWFETNIPTWDFVEDFELTETQDRPVLQGTADLGLIKELAMPLVTLPSVGPGQEEKELKVDIQTNQEGSTIYYVVLDTETELTKEAIMSPSGVLFSGSGSVISETHLMAEFDTTYFVYYVVELADESVSEVFTTSGKSKVMTELVISGGLRPGALNKELVINLETNLPSTIYYIIVDAAGEYTDEEIKLGTDALFKDSGSIISNVTHLMADADTEYFFYAYAEASDRDGRANGSGKSGSSEVINYGTGTEVDPFIIRSVNDLAAIGSGSYNGNGVDLTYANNAHYVLANNIDLSLVYGEGKQSWTPIAEFKGTLNGAGFTINGLYIKGSGAGRFGFIKYINNGVVKNLNFENSTVIIESDGTTYDHNDNAVGTLAGHVGNSSVIENIRIINGSVNALRERVGGLVGSSTDHSTNANNIFKNIYVEANVTGTGRTGGVFGNLGGTQSQTRMLVSDIVFIGEVKATTNNRVGGVIGWTQHSSIQNVYVDAVVEGLGSGNNVGGVVGYTQDSATAVIVNNILVNVKVTHSGSNNIGTIIGAKQSTSNPTVTNVYETEASSITFVGESTSGNSFQAEVLPLEFNAAWFETNMPGFNTQNGWEFKVGSQRPSLIGTPDDGLFGVLEA